MDSFELGYSTSFLVLVFCLGIALGYFIFFMYRRYSRRKLIRTLYESHFPEETTGFFDHRSGFYNTYGTLAYNSSTTPRMYSISNPILPRASLKNDLLSTLRPFPPLPDLEVVNIEHDFSRRSYQNIRASNNLKTQNLNEPSIGRHLRLAVRSCLHLAEVSPESITVDQIIYTKEQTETCQNLNQKNTLSLLGTTTSNLKYETNSNSKKPTTPVLNDLSRFPPGKRAIRKKGEFSKKDIDQRLGNILGEDNKKKLPSEVLQDKPLFTEVFSEAEPTNSDEETFSFKTQRDNKDKNQTCGSINKKASSKSIDLVKIQPLKNAAASRSVTFDDNSIGGSVLFSGLMKQTLPTVSPSKYLLDKHFFSDEKVQEWVLPEFGKVRFTDHAPVAFRLIRRFFGYTIRDFDIALSSPFGSITSTEGKSNSIFFLSHNNARFLFKTLRNSEPENLKNLLPDYLEHIKRNPNTLLPRYLGMYTFERLSSVSSKESASPALQRGLQRGSQRGSQRGLQRGSQPGPSGFRDPASGLGSGLGSDEKHFEKSFEKNFDSFPLPQQQVLSSDESFPNKMVIVVMSNVFDTSLSIGERYDFKGSSVGRHTLPESLGNLPPTSKERSQDISHLTLKDLDFQYRVSQGLRNMIQLGPSNRKELIDQLETDLNLLKKFALMDYSVLIGISKTPITPLPHISVPTPPTSVRISRSGSITSYDLENSSPVSSPLAQASLIKPFYSASNFLNSLLPGKRSSTFLKESLVEESGNLSRNSASIPGLSPFANDTSSQPPVWQNGVRSSQSTTPEIYFIGIIDALQKYTIVKWIEKGLKGYNTRLLGPLNSGLQTPTSASFAFTNRQTTTTTDSYSNVQSNECSTTSNFTEGPRKSSLASSALNLSTTKVDVPKSNHSTPYLFSTPEPISLSSSRNGPDSSNSNLHKPSNPISSTPHPTPRLGTPMNGFSFLQQNEHSVEEPGRYAERLLDYIKSIVV